MQLACRPDDMDNICLMVIVFLSAAPSTAAQFTDGNAASSVVDTLKTPF